MADFRLLFNLFFLNSSNNSNKNLRSRPSTETICIVIEYLILKAVPRIEFFFDDCM